MSANGAGGQACYGRLTFADGTWVVKAEPHVMIRLRRHFPRAERSKQGVVELRDPGRIAADVLTRLWRRGAAIAGVG